MLTLAMIAWMLLPIVAPCLITLTLLAVLVAAPSVTISESAEEPATVAFPWLQALEDACPTTVRCPVFDLSLDPMVTLDISLDALESYIDTKLVQGVYYAKTLPSMQYAPTMPGG